MPPFFLCRLLPAALISFSSLHAQDALPVLNPGFEQHDSEGRVSQWEPEGTLLRGEVAPDSLASHGGRYSLRILHREPGSTRVASARVFLQVGRPYRLRCWIRTDHARTDSSARYPTPVAATVSMESFPFTNVAPPVGGTGGWRAAEIRFFATQAADRIILTLGHNGSASGTAWFDDVSLEPVSDISEMIPPETVRWHGPAFRYTDGGWTFVHIEGEPYERGSQLGALLSREIVGYIEKLAIRANGDVPRQGWADTRLLADALMFRRFDPELLEEMKGIADGAAAAGAQVYGRPLDLLDVVTLNSAVDLGQLGGALAKTANPLSGRSFNAAEQELQTAERLHKCSSFLANGPATPDGSIVFGQLFMWNGYTGEDWDVICDVVPARGHRLVYETFPGGIHSGADFYINDAGIMIGETTVMQTPFDPAGTPQSSRIRKAAQYAGSIDDVVRILTEGNNGLYTNDWLIGDARTNETAILLLGTKRWKLWRSTDKDVPGGTTGFLWSVNNAKDPEVRKEYIPDPFNAPVDIVFGPVNRDLAFMELYHSSRGQITGPLGMRALATSPLNRPHACDGKVTTSEMARRLMFHAHFGKVTFREKFPEKNNRLMPDLPGARPHLSLGYTTFSPIVVAEELRKHRGAPASVPAPSPENLSAVGGTYEFPKTQLWMNTVFPAGNAENWFVSGTAAYWNMLNGLPADRHGAMAALRDQLADMNARLAYTINREGPLAPLRAERRYDRFKDYAIPRIRGTFLLHQLRLRLGNENFGRLMQDVHTRFREKAMTTAQFLGAAERVAGADLRPFVMQWLERDDLPSPRAEFTSRQEGDHWRVQLTVRQEGVPYAFLTSVAIDTTGGTLWLPVSVDGRSCTASWTVQSEPRTCRFNAGQDVPVATGKFFTFANFYDEFSRARIVYGTRRQIEGQHTLALRLQTTLADAFTETLTPIRKDSELDPADLRQGDLIVLGGPADNAVADSLARTGALEASRNLFRWRGGTYSDPEDGLFLALPNPWNPSRAVYWFIGNSALELASMLKRPVGLPGWARFKGDQVVERGYTLD